MKRLEHMKSCLSDLVSAQMGDLKNVDTKELGEAIDMIKDLSEAIYYCTITEAMHTEYPSETHYYTEPHKKMWDRKRMEPYEEQEYQMPEMRDPREGRSYMSRKMYMESKEMGHDKLANIQDLERYMNELSADITEMIENSSMEEKQLLQKKLNMLAQKIVNG